MVTETSRLLIEPVIHYPRVAQVGKTYLMTIDLRADEPFDWQGEEYPVYCRVSSNSFKIKSLSEPIVILHRMGGNYGESRFLLEANRECSECIINISLNNQWGVSILNISLDSSIVARFNKKEETQNNFTFPRFSKGESSQHEYPFQRFHEYFKPLLGRLYSEAIVTQLTTEIFELIQKSLSPSGQENLKKWNHNDVLLITCGDSIVNGDRPPLEVLAEFLETHLEGTVTGVHILPFFPYSSDDGFAVIDYLQVNPELGTWDHVRRIAKHFNLMVDLVINHVSSQHQWFQQFKAGELPGRNYFVTSDPREDLSQVVRPRSSPLLTPVETTDGEKHVWTTFSADQVDVNFENPDLLIEYIKIILAYVEAGARYIRLNAVGFLWKKHGTNCMHLPETHAVVRLFREILQLVDPGISLITETNVPNRENLSYFGNRNEAHMIYNFSLPPLLLNALMQGRSDHLKTWMMSMPPAPIGCAYFNFTASHDGIGMRPAEGLLAADEYEQLIVAMRDFGGKISMRSRPDGTESPYEINISLFDALKGTVKGEDQWQIERFLCSQTIMMSLEGIPAFYIHSLLATHNYTEGVKKTGHDRTINRYKWDLASLEVALADPTTTHAKVLKELTRLIKIRRQQTAFHPNATQYTLHPLNSALFAFWRQSLTRDQSIFSVHNLSDKPQDLHFGDLHLVSIDEWFDLIGGEKFADLEMVYRLKPYQSMWITNKVDV